MNNQDRAAMQTASEALEGMKEIHKTEPIRRAKQSLREALSQPQGEWVDLTDDDKSMILVDCMGPHALTGETMNLLTAFNLGVEAAIAKFKSKNTPQVAPQGEPVAYRYKVINYLGNTVWTLATPRIDTTVLESQPLYTALAAIREALAEQEITTPDVCGEVCARAKLCYGCGKALDEANAKHEPLCEDEGCPHHGTPHICFSDPSVLDKPFACETGECPDKSLCAGACECLYKAEPVHLVKQEPVAFMFKVKRTTKSITVLDEFAAIDYFPQDNEEIVSKEPLSYAAPVQPVKQEPVAWALMHKNGLEFNTGYGMVETLQQAEDMQRRHLGNLKVVPLYTTPPSVEAAIEATKEQIIETVKNIDETHATRMNIIAAIRSMK